MRKLLLFGGTGFVGSRVLHRALQRGWRVVCATRGGVPPAGNALLDAARQYRHHAAAEFQDDAARDISLPDSPLDFVALDATSRAQVFDFFADHPDASAVVSCIGRLTRDHEEARRICGDANVNIAAAVYERGRAVQRLVLVSAEPYNASLPLLDSRWLLKGYFYGKKIAERAVLENLGSRGVVLRPGFIHGTRHIAIGGEWAIALPLGAVGLPAEALLRTVGRRSGLFVPPVSVDTVAEAAVRTMEPSAPSGVLDYFGMVELCAREEQRRQIPQEGMSGKEQ